MLSVEPGSAAPPSTGGSSSLDVLYIAPCFDIAAGIAFFVPPPPFFSPRGGNGFFPAAPLSDFCLFLLLNSSTKAMPNRLKWGEAGSDYDGDPRLDGG